jgi:beta-lactamase regulating signal transducer with metallopeptidase domain
MLCILYVIALGTGLGVVGLLVERALPATWPRRWVWCAVIALSVTVPGFYRFHYTSSITTLLDESAAGSHGHGAHAAAMLTPLDVDWWARAEAYDSTINRVWLLASALLIAWGLSNAWRVGRVVRRARQTAGDPRRMDVIDGVPVVVTESIGPATAGVLRSRVLIPRWVLALPGTQRQYIVRHEEEHRAAHDARLLCLASLTLILVPWNAALWWQLRRLFLAVEMDCDRRVVAALGDANAYGDLLLRVAEAASRGPRIQPALLGRVGMLERRLRVLVAETPRRTVERILAPVLACVLLALVLSLPHPVLPREVARRAAPVAGHPTSPGYGASRSTAADGPDATARP